MTSGAVLPPSRGDRPREKLERAGPDALGDNEVLAVIVGHGTAAADALGVANRLLGAAGGVHGLARMSAGELSRIAGVGPALASRIRAAIELGRRTLTPPAERVLVRSPHDAGRFLVPQFGAYPVERFGVVLLDTGFRVLRTCLLSTGSLDATLADPRDVFREAVTAGAAAVVVFHNHPSGDPQPSADDIDLTRRLAAAGEVLGIQLVDHLILTNTRYSSLMRPRETT